MSHWKTFRLGTLAILCTMTTTLSMGSMVALAGDQTRVNVTVNPSAPIVRIPSTALGVNTQVWDTHLMDASIPSLIKRIGATMLRYPGGSAADVYHWQTNTWKGQVLPQNNFDSFMGLVQKAGAQPIITVNAGDRDPAEAAAWVKYANVTHKYNVNYWEIGNEMYGKWEHGNFAGNPAGYANLASTYIKAMKAVDPSIHVGVVLAPPGEGWSQWDQVVMQTLQQNGTLPNFGIVHWYSKATGNLVDPGLLASTQQIPGWMTTLKENLAHYGKISVWVTETNSGKIGQNSVSLVNSVFLDDDLSTWIQSGAANVDWWALHAGIRAAPPVGSVTGTVYNSTNWGDYGLLSSGESLGNMHEPPANTPFPDYYGYEMLGSLIQPGGTMVGTGSSNPLVASHAALLPNGDLSVMLINNSSSTTYPVNLQLEGFMTKGDATKLYYGQGSKGVSISQVADLQSVSLSPYSVTVLLFSRHAGHQPQGPHLTDTVSVSGLTTKPGDTETVSAVFRETRAQLYHATLDLEIYNSGGDIVGQKTVPNVSLKPGQSYDTTIDWVVPNIPGSYTVRAFVFSQSGAATYLADQNARTFRVTATNPN